jgi:hypothetical protein
MTFGFFAQVSIATMILIALAQPVQAQGNMGGSIGVQEKSVSGDREAPRAAPPPPRQKRSAPEPKRSAPEARRSAPEPKRASRSSGGGGGGANYDGVWHVTNIGCGAGSGAVSVSGGRITAGATSGSVSSSGSVRTASANSVGWGRLSGNRGSGGFRTNDGCTGRWTASR